MDNANLNMMKQESHSLAGQLPQKWSAGKTSLRLGYSRCSADQVETEFEVDFDRSFDAYGLDR